jgi:hypothetical protein
MLSTIIDDFESNKKKTFETKFHLPFDSLFIHSIIPGGIMIYKSKKTNKNYVYNYYDESFYEHTI